MDIDYLALCMGFMLREVQHLSKRAGRMNMSSPLLKTCKMMDIGAWFVGD